MNISELINWITRAKNANTHYALLRASDNTKAAEAALEKREQARIMARAELEKLMSGVN